MGEHIDDGGAEATELQGIDGRVELGHDLTTSQIAYKFALSLLSVIPYICPSAIPLQPMTAKFNLFLLIFSPLALPLAFGFLLL